MSKLCNYFWFFMTLIGLGVGVGILWFLFERFFL